ncbi:CFC_HP_G0057190.mRNA.1.CDS.1 [Saccharomyces cerevisiae]|nr:CFC_HP_G0057190.mRNA.1.CDS.1 [Saccharomyces cerevisiae]CAI6540379.1 CFC_HP_G0057190.mRNA.1.CDS.1 [Saccharomyces cerevisiae]
MDEFNYQNVYLNTQSKKPKLNRFGSFAPVRTNSFCQILIVFQGTKGAFYAKFTTSKPYTYHKVSQSAATKYFLGTHQFIVIDYWWYRFMLW